MASFEPWHQQISVGTQAMHERLPLYHNKSGVQRMQHFGISSDLKRSFSSAYLKPGLNEDSHAQYHQYVFSVYISMVHALAKVRLKVGFIVKCLRPSKGEQTIGRPQWIHSHRHPLGSRKKILSAA